VKVRVVEDALDANNTIARANRDDFDSHDVTVVNLMSAPGAGKTTLLERTIRELGSVVSIHVIEGDQETDNDAARIRAAGARAVQVNTGTGCHLDAEMVGRALDHLDPPPESLVIIENVGNLVCPALFDLGEQAKVVIMSIPEGEDKPVKYPYMFRASDVMLLNKIDLLPYIPFDVEGCVARARRINPALELLQVSATRGDGLDGWYAWVQARRARCESAAGAGRSHE
jgi:hydrogenase nickel incorporation protein HypB